MKDGNVFAQGAPRDVITEENILAVYGTHAEIKNGEYVITSL
jgi:ABC-type cobalamin/Fe3+-siderophores transport system ATPase subunit